MPSRLASAGWCAWLAMAAVLAALAGMTPVWRLASIVLVLGFGITPMWRHILLRGDRAVRALEWPDCGQGRYYVLLGQTERRLAAIPDGCRRYGPYCWLLRFRTSEGLAQVLIDTRRQDPRALRRLARRLFGTERSASGVPAARRRGADTIRAKV